MMDQLALVDWVALECFIKKALVRAGAATEEAVRVAETATWCDAAGRNTYGIWRLPLYCDRLEQGGIRSPAEFTIEQQSPSVQIIDGQHGFGQLAMRAAAESAIATARELGLGLTLVRHSNHCGALSYYGAMAADAGCVALLATNAYPRVIAHGGSKPFLGTNPIAFAAPGEDGRHLLVDLSTSTVAGSVIVQLAEASNGSVEGGLATDSEGNQLVDPSRFAEGGLLPMAGAKGFALGVMVEVLCGVLSSAAIGSELNSVYNDRELPGGNGQFFLAIDVDRVVGTSNYHDLHARLLKQFADAGEGVRIPGHARHDSLERSRSVGIRLNEVCVAKIGEIADRYSIAAPELEWLKS